MEAAGKVIVVTGGASGIGRALCERFAAEAARQVVVADLDGEGAAKVAERIGSLSRQVDVGVEADLAALIDHTERECGPIDLFCSNAGIGIGEGLDEPDEVWDRIWRVNTMSHVWAARHLVPRMIARGGGYLLSTASAAGLLTQIGSVTYAVTKHAAVALAEWIAITHGRDGIKVSVLCPQAVRTAMTADGPGVAGVDGETGEPLLQRDDDREATVRERLAVYRRQTEPLIAFYKERARLGGLRYLAVDGGRSVEAVQSELAAALG